MKLFLSIYIGVFLASCATYTQQTELIRSEFQGGQYQSALTKLEDSGLKDDNGSKLLYHLEKASILERMGEHEKARKELFLADKIVDFLYSVSISKSAASFIVGDYIQDYEGEDFEKIAIHTKLALSFISDQNFKSARIEARKIHSRLREITKDYDERNNSYKEDAFARYLVGMIYEVLGEDDSSIIEYNKALKIFSSPSYQKLYEGPIPKDLIIGLYLAVKKKNRNTIVKQLEREYPELIKTLESFPKEGFGQLLLIHEAGFIAVKKEKSFIFPFGNQVVRFSFPSIYRRHLDQKKTGISVKDIFYPASNVINMNELAFTCLEDRRGRMLLKNSARLLIKGQMALKAHQEYGPLAGLAVNLAGAFTETADTRSWTLLPEAYYTNRILLPVGKQDIKIYTDGKVSELMTIEIQAGKSTILRSF